MNTEKLVNLAVSDTGFIFDPTTGQTYNTNALGMEIIRLLKKNCDPPQIIEKLLEQYAVSANELELDVMDYIRNLKNFHLLS